MTEGLAQQLQRAVGGLQADLAAIEKRIDHLSASGKRR